MDRASRRVALVVGDLRRQAGSGGGATPHVVAAGSVSVMGAPGLRNAITWAGVGSQYFSGVSAQDVGRRRGGFHTVRSARACAVHTSTDPSEQHLRRTSTRQCDAQQDRRSLSLSRAPTDAVLVRASVIATRGTPIRSMVVPSTHKQDNRFVIPLVCRLLVRAIISKTRPRMVLSAILRVGRGGIVHRHRVCAYQKPTKVLPMERDELAL